MTDTEPFFKGPLFDGQGLEFQHLQLEAQRRQSNRQAAEQSAQSNRIIALLEQQQAERNQEQRRLASLPKCPACLAPVEVGARKCGKCQSEIMSWDNRSFRLICLRADAQSQIESHLVAIADRLKRCLEAASEQAQELMEAIKRDILPASQTLRKAADSAKGISSREVLSMYHSYCARKRVANHTQAKELEERRAEVKQMRTELDEWEKKISLEKEAVYLGGFLGKSLFVLGFLMAFLFGLSSCGVQVVQLRRDSGGAVVNHPEEMQQRAGQLRVFYSVLGLAAAGVAVIVFGSLLSGSSESRRAQSIAQMGDEQSKLKSAIEAKEAAIQASVEKVHSGWIEKFTKTGILPHLETLSRRSEQLENGLATLTPLLRRIDEDQTEMAEVMAFAATAGLNLVLQTPLTIQPIPAAPTLAGVCDSCIDGDMGTLRSLYENLAALKKATVVKIA